MSGRVCLTDDSKRLVAAIVRRPAKVCGDVTQYGSKANEHERTFGRTRVAYSR